MAVTTRTRSLANPRPGRRATTGPGGRAVPTAMTTATPTSLAGPRPTAGVPAALGAATGRRAALPTQIPAAVGAGTGCRARTRAAGARCGRPRRGRGRPAGRLPARRGLSRSAVRVDRLVPAARRADRCFARLDRVSVVHRARTVSVTTGARRTGGVGASGSCRAPDERGRGAVRRGPRSAGSLRLGRARRGRRRRAAVRVQRAEHAVHRVRRGRRKHGCGRKAGGRREDARDRGDPDEHRESAATLAGHRPRQ